MMAGMRLWCFYGCVILAVISISHCQNASSKSQLPPAEPKIGRTDDAKASKSEDKVAPPKISPRAPQQAPFDHFIDRDDEEITENIHVDMNEFRRQLMYPYENKQRLDISQWKSLHDQALTFRLPFFGFEYRYIWINQNGFVSFNRGPKTFRPDMQLPLSPPESSMEEDPSMIAIFLALQEQSLDRPNSGIYLKVVDLANEKNRSLAERLVLDFQSGMIGAGDFKPSHAIIISWIHMRVAGGVRELKKTNSYQMVLATDEKRTYAMFNYERLQWSSSQDVYDGVKHIQGHAYIGFNAGNTTRTYEFKPYSREPRILDLATKYGLGNGLRGRFFFQIDEEIWPGTCIDKELDPNLPDRLPLTFFPRYGNMLGGTVVNVTGPCLSKASRIRCRFETLAVRGYFRDENHASCIAPTNPFLKYHGYVDLSVEVDDRNLFVGRYYIQPPDVVDEDVVVHDYKETEEAPLDLYVTWNKDKLYWNPNAQVMLTLWGYRESQDLYPSLEYINKISLNAIPNGVQSYTILTENFNDNWDAGKHDMAFGFISVNLTHSPFPGESFDPKIWSPPIPLSWYFNKQWRRVYGPNWKERYCKNWFYKEREIERFAITVPRCPCTMRQAMLDIGRFTPDKHCNIIDRKCDVFHMGAVHCVRSGRPAIATGSSQMCCYDNYGELLQTGDTMYGGRPSRASMFGKHPFQTRMMIPTLSHWVYDVIPFFHCCKWNSEEDDSETCQMYNYWRTSQDCSLYHPPAVGSVFGDPHLVTFDGVTYTFNGKGEFSLLRVHNNFYKLDIQGRFEQVPNENFTAHPINATYLTAVVAKSNHSAKVEFRVRPKEAQWRYHIYVIVDGEYVFFWDKTLQMQYFKGVTLFQPAGIANMSHIIAMFDSGAGLEVKTVRTHMSLHVFLPKSFKNMTGGLLGRYSGDKTDDFVDPDGNIVASPSSSSQDIYNRFGKKWRVTPEHNDKIGSTLFIHEHVNRPWAYFDDPYFKPDFIDVFQLPQDMNLFWKDKLKSVCSDDKLCRYDFITTRNPEYAGITAMQHREANMLTEASKKTEIRCPALPKPVHGRKSDNRYYTGTNVIFSCEAGYRLVGHEVRKCRDDGLWSWGIEAECVTISQYNKRVAGVVVAIVIPVVFFVLMAIGCYVFRSRKRDSHYTGESGMHSRAVIEMTKKTDRNSSGQIPAEKSKLETEA